MKSFFGKYHKKTILPVICLVCIGCLSACGSRTVEYRSADTAMGTVLQVSLYVTADPQEDGKELTEEVRTQIIDLERQELSRRVPDSVIGRINGLAAQEQSGNEAARAEDGSIEMQIPQALYQELLLVQEVSKASNGALDITLGKVAKLWNLDTAAVQPQMFQLPAKAALQEALACSGFEKITLIDGKLQMMPGILLDLGAVGKGIACDRLLAWLETKEQISGAVIALGGSILTYGEKPDGKEWKVGIVDPSDTSSYLGTLSLEGRWCVATSGDYERYVEAEGIRYHHILDPETGYPAQSGLKSVTIFGHSGCLCDALSTACFVLGAEEGLKLAEQYGVYAVMAAEDGTLFLSKGAEAYFTAD